MRYLIFLYGFSSIISGCAKPHPGEAKGTVVLVGSSQSLDLRAMWGNESFWPGVKELWNGTAAMEPQKAKKCAADSSLSELLRWACWSVGGQTLPLPSDLTGKPLPDFALGALLFLGADREIPEVLYPSTELPKPWHILLELILGVRQPTSFDSKFDLYSLDEEYRFLLAAHVLRYRPEKFPETLSETCPLGQSGFSQFPCWALLGNLARLFGKALPASEVIMRVPPGIDSYWIAFRNLNPQLALQIKNLLSERTL